MKEALEHWNKIAGSLSPWEKADWANKYAAQLLSENKQMSQALRALPVSDGVTDEMVNALRRQTENMAFILNRVDLPEQWYAVFTQQLAEDRAALGATVSDGWEDIAREPAGLIEAIMNAGPIGCCNINERNASDILFEISEYMKAKKGE